jgi:outer membrane protein assembly factor BamE (lipoprotein component of BamABCDE complex)
MRRASTAAERGGAAQAAIARSLRRLGLVAAVAATVTACQVVKVYIGSPITTDPATVITVGETTSADVLTVFGAPDEIDRRVNGDVFTYLYVRRNERTISIEEPVVTNTEIYTYTEVIENSERLVVLFDANGVVTGYGYRNGIGAVDRPLLSGTPDD